MLSLAGFCLQKYGDGLLVPFCLEEQVGVGENEYCCSVVCVKRFLMGMWVWWVLL